MTKTITALGYEFNVSDEQASKWDAAIDASNNIALLAALECQNAALRAALELCLESGQLSALTPNVIRTVRAAILNTGE